MSPHARHRSIPFYTENYRVLTMFDSDHFGPVAMVEIGSMVVGSIPQRYRPGEHAAKGQKKSFFELGGSTVVLLFEPTRIAFDEDLCANTQTGVETYVRMGERIGVVPATKQVEHA